MDRADALAAARELLVLRGVLDDPAGHALRAMLEAHDPDAVRRARDELWLLLAGEAEMSQQEMVGNIWQNHLLERLLRDENSFSRKLQQATLDQIGPAMQHAVADDLERLYILYRLEMPDQAEGRLQWDGVRPLGNAPAHPFKHELARLAGWRDSLAGLAAHYSTGSTGVFAGAVAFRWHHAGALEAIRQPDPIHLNELIGYDTERRLLIRNTEHFLAGFPANHVLISGDPGTGKSSTVKALLHEYSRRGLRMVEVSRHDLADLPAIIALLRERPERFILFVDDLSFEEHETSYKDLKALLEGTLEARPANILVYATSNRRHIIRERFTDRGTPGSNDDDDVHPLETMQEKLSFSDRFGVTVRFHAPDQARFLAIVDGLARQRGLPIEATALHERALQWVMRQHGRSGRTARQFIDHLAAELAPAKQQQATP